MPQPSHWYVYPSDERTTSLVTATADPRVGADQGPLTPVQVAAMLNTTSRQVHAWAARRDTTGFPDPIASLIAPTGGGRKRAPMYDPADVMAWWVYYDPSAGRGAYWASRPPRTRRVGPCEVCGERADVKVIDGDPIIHGRCRR